MGQIISQSDIEGLMGTLGVDWLTDDGTQAGLIQTVIEAAEGWIFSKLAFKYPAATLAMSPVVKHATTYLAAYYLSERRGLPWHYKEQVDELKEEIEDLRAGKAELTDDNGNQLSQDLGHDPISMQNQVVDERYAKSRIRTVSETSTQTANVNIFTNDGFYGLFGF